MSGSIPCVSIGELAALPSPRETLNIPEIFGGYLARAASQGTESASGVGDVLRGAARYRWLDEDCLAMRRARRMPKGVARRLVWRHLPDFKTFRRYLTGKRMIYRETTRLSIGNAMESFELGELATEGHKSLIHETHKPGSHLPFPSCIGSRSAELAGQHDGARSSL